MSEERCLDLDFVSVQGDRAQDAWTVQMRKALRDYQNKHGAIGLDHLDILELKHPSPAGMRFMLMIRKRGDRVAPAAHSPSGGSKKKGEHE